MERRAFLKGLGLFLASATIDPSGILVPERKIWALGAPAVPPMLGMSPSLREYYSRMLLGRLTPALEIANHYPDFDKPVFGKRRFESYVGA